MTQVIEIEENTAQKFSKTQLERFINGADFEDLILAYHMKKGETGITQSYSDFKKEVGLL